MRRVIIAAILLLLVAATVAVSARPYAAPRCVVRAGTPVDVVLQVSLDIGYVILYTSSLSFLGLGAQPPTAEWGAMLSEARQYVTVASGLGGALATRFGAAKVPAGGSIWTFALFPETTSKR